jgi:hypothetical protein
VRVPEIRTEVDGQTYENLRATAALNRLTLKAVVRTLLLQGIRESENHHKREERDGPG